MNCFLTLLRDLDAGDVENAFMCAERKLMATTHATGCVRVYDILDDDFSLKLVREFNNHQSPVVSVNFAPLIYRNFVLTVGFDRCLHLYNLDDGKAAEPVFSFYEEGKEIGLLTAAAFIPYDKARLAFVVGTSTGDLIVFDSHSNFAAQYRKPFSGYVKSIAGSQGGEVLVSAVGKGVQLFLDAEFANPVEIGSGLHTNAKVSQVGFAPSHPASDAVRFFTAGEDNKLGVWSLDSETKGVDLLQQLELDGSIIGAFWNISALSLTVFLSKKTGTSTETEAVVVASELEAEEGSWAVTPINLVR